MGIFSAVLDLLFPEKCPFCRRLLQKDEDGLCAACAKDLPFTHAGGKQSGSFYDLCVSPLWYEEKVRDAMLRFKFGGVSAYAKTFGKMIADCVRENLDGQYDLISWVPLSAKRLKKRGYDQAKLLAEAAALTLGDTAVKTLEKFVDVPAQSGTGGAAQRRANISGAYRAADAERIAGKRILLIDDIVTTGSTLSECARILRGAGAEKVVCATLARTRET